MLAELMLSSWETIARRSWMIADGSCSLDEYQRMVGEKLTAAQSSALALMIPGDDPLSAAIAPWHRRARSNALRLRRKK